MSSVSVGVRIPSNLYEKLMAHISKTHISKSEAIISALAQYLESTEDIPLSQRMAEVEKKLAVLESKVEMQ